MKRLFLLLLFAPFLLPCLAEEPFVRVTSLDEITEDGEYVIGAKALDNRPFYLMQSTLKNKHFQAFSSGNAVPDEIEANTDAAVCHFVRHGAKWVLTIGDMFVKAASEKNTNVSLSPTDYTSWTATFADGKLYLQNGERYFLIYSKESSAVFGNYTLPSYNEGPLIIYKRSVPHSSMTEYSRIWETTGWEILCLPFSCALPQGFEAYHIESVEGNNLQQTPASFLEAGTAYVVKGTAGALFSVRKASGYAAAPQESLLTGTYAPRRLTTGYVLDGTDFVPAADGCLLPAFCAFLQP